jgi:hypothetical protein
MTQSVSRIRFSQILAAISALTVSLGVTHQASGDAASKDASKMLLSPAATQEHVKQNVVTKKMSVKQKTVKMQTIKLTNANAKPMALTVKQTLKQPTSQSKQ